MAKNIGPYELVDRISSGGMGEIYLARLVREGGFEKAVAVKQILPHLARQPEFIKMFEAEARLSAQLNHANVVHVYDFGRDGDNAWIAMEYVDGYDLRAVLDKGGAPDQGLSHELALYVVEQCALALDYAYRRKNANGQPLRVIHRDVSPQNVLISMEGEVKLTDFGLAKACSLETWSMSGMLKGKLAYMAPEQARGETIDSRADIFALGLVFHEMLCGRRLYPPKTAIAPLMDMVRQADFKPFSVTIPGLPSQLCDLLDRCLASDPGERFSFAADLAQAARKTAGELGYNAASQELSVYVQALDTTRVSPLSWLDSGTAVSEKPISPGFGTEATLFAKMVPSDKTVTNDSVHPKVEPATGTLALSSSDIAQIQVTEEVGSWLHWAVAIAIASSLCLGGWVWSQQPQFSPSEARQSPVELSPSSRSAVVVLPETKAVKSKVEIVPELKAELTVSVASESARCHLMSLLDKKTRSFECRNKQNFVPGPYRLVVSAPGFQTALGVDVELIADTPQEMEVTLQPLAVQPCRLAITSKPAGARLSLDGKIRPEQTPLRLEKVTPGEHTIRLSRSGYQDALLSYVCDRTSKEELEVALKELFLKVQIGSQHLRLRSGRARSTKYQLGNTELTIRVKTSPKSSVLMISAKPYASLLVNGKSRGVTPQSLSIKHGNSYNLTFRRETEKIGGLRVKIAPDTKPKHESVPGGTTNGG